MVDDGRSLWCRCEAVTVYSEATQPSVVWRRSYSAEHSSDRLDQTELWQYRNSEIEQTNIVQILRNTFVQAPI